MKKTSIYLFMYALIFQVFICTTFCISQNTYHKSIILSPSTENAAADGACDLSGNIYILGYNRDNFNLFEMYLSKVSIEGKVMWIKTFQDCNPVNIIWNIDSTFSILFRTKNSPNMGDLALIKLDTLGNILKTKLFETANPKFAKVKLLTYGTFCVSGYTIDLNNSIYYNFILNLDSNYNLLYANQYGYASSISSNEFCVDNARNYYAAGYIRDSSNHFDTKITKLDSLGNVTLTKVFDFGGRDLIYSSVYVQQKIYTLGIFDVISPQGSVSQNYVACFDTSLNLLWSKVYYTNSSGGGGLDRIYNFQIDSSILIQSAIGYMKLNYNLQ